MDKGAHFHRCDFQVHTPRDKQWSGAVPQDDAERKTFAEELVRDCRSKGLQAVAITDHHDLAYFEYIKEAASNEVDDEGAPVPDACKLTVFPGMEITLSLPCQVLLILDSEFPPSMLGTVCTALAIPITDKNDLQCPQTVAQTQLRSLIEMHEMLDKQDHIKGRYIILPNVGDGGHKTLLRTSFQAHYSDMPCIGGYVDGPITKLGNKKHITDGKDRNYGFKSIGVLATSDNRCGNFTELGIHSTWVKWAEPTAEAIRQACLAKETRIAHEEPELPALWVSSIEVNQSKFMGPINLDLNTQYNCLIGGRGTGKSTVLEYLRWGLCDQPPSFSDEDELPDFQAKRSNLIARTLVPLDATVAISVQVNGVPHIVRRRAQDGKVSLKIGDGEFGERTEEEIRTLLPLQAYSQKQLSSVGVRTDELVRFIRSPLKKQLDVFDDEETKFRAGIRKHYGALRAKTELERQIERETLELDSLAKQEKSLRGQLKGLNDEDQKILAAHDSFVQEGQFVSNWQQNIQRIREVISEASDTVAPLPDRPEVADDLPNASLIKKTEQAMVTLADQVRARLAALSKDIVPESNLLTPVEKHIATWTSASDEHEAKYEGAKQKASSQQKLLAQIKEVEDRTKQVRLSINGKQSELAKCGTPETKYTEARIKWVELFRARAELLSTKCEELTALSGKRIRARLKRGSGVDAVREKLEGIISGTRIRSKKIESLCMQIAESPDSVKEWDEILSELEALAKLPKEDDGDLALPDCERLREADFGNADLEKLVRKVSLDDWLDLSLVELSEIPIFEYEQREEDYIPFASASAGQQATALLRVLLGQDGPPLIIDQPEEDLDNQVILEIVQDIWKAKTHRQVIFSSHNANIVVNGDADLVVCCDYRKTSDQSSGRIKCEGAIDIEEIRQEITLVMEGGKDAFRLRQEKYGF